jgi:hypothetical protein
MVAGNYLAYLSGYGFGIGTRYVPSMQGFFVHVYDGGAPNYNNTSGTVKFTNANRTTIGTVNFYKDEPDDMIWLKVEKGNGLFDQAIVYFKPELTTGYDRDLDAVKMPGNAEAPQLYALATDDTRLCIDGLPFEDVNTIVPIEFSVASNGAGPYTLMASKLETFRYGATVTLEDKKTGKMQDLMSNPVYNFSYSEGDNPSRFALHFYNPFYGIDDEDKEKQEMQIYSFGHDVYLKDLTGHPEEGEFYLFNEMGQEILEKPVSAITLNKISLNVNTGYYIVRVITKDKAFTGKVYLN